jgi:hypothetical protein
MFTEELPEDFIYCAWLIQDDEGNQEGCEDFATDLTKGRWYCADHAYRIIDQGR